MENFFDTSLFFIISLEKSNLFLEKLILFSLFNKLLLEEVKWKDFLIDS